MNWTYSSFALVIQKTNALYEIILNIKLILTNSHFDIVINVMIIPLLLNNLYYMKMSYRLAEHIVIIIKFDV